MPVLKDFREFATRGNVIDLAVGIIIGAAFGRIVTSVVNDILMPVINPLTPQEDWKSLVIWPGIKLGAFIGTVLDFLIVALALFLIIKVVNRLHRKKENVPIPPLLPSKEEILLTEIRDLLKSRQNL